MRELKFRVWRPLIEEMDECTNPCNEPGNIVMQFTGLKDKNGVEFTRGTNSCFKTIFTGYFSTNEERFSLPG